MFRQQFGQLATIACLVATFPIFTQAQVLNGEFDNGTNWWFEVGSSEIEITSDAYQSGQAVKVSNRDQYWLGIGQELNGDLQVGKDYHFQCWVKLIDAPTGEVRIEIRQTDDRGERFIKIAGVQANDSGWTLLEGGFHLMVNGALQDLRFHINGDINDSLEFDFLIDSVSITENDWRADANARIELHRKRDVELQFVGISGNPFANVEVEVEQIGHQFGFGSTLNERFATDPEYSDFFKNHFDWASIEWHSQWKAVEEVRGQLSYQIADQSVDFARQNGIQIRGHALAWGDPNFVPSWLPALSDSEIQSELDDRIDDAVSRYSGLMQHWDVNNEMLRNTFFQDRLGNSARAQMFTRAQSLDPKVKLFTNEVNVVNGRGEADQYRELIQSLQATGAPIGGIGIQSHFFDGTVSPKAIEIGLSKLTDLGPKIWFTEFDVVNPDVDERAKALEVFYRYAFSVPEASGAIMWGFWEGAHWLDDAYLVDLDWTVNAAGQQYFDLLDEWTTSETAEASPSVNSLTFRGFHGNYLVKTTTKPSNVVNYHLVSIVPGDGTQTVPLTIAARKAGTVLVYGTEGDDLIEYDLDAPDSIKINGTNSPIPTGSAITGFRVDGGAGDDHLVVRGSSNFDRFVLSQTRLSFIGNPFLIHHENTEKVEAIAGVVQDTATLLDSPLDDTVESYPDQTTMTVGSTDLIASRFDKVYGWSYQGNDVANLYDSPEDDFAFTRLEKFINLTQGDRLRRMTNFKECHFYSNEGDDRLYCLPKVGERMMELKADESHFSFQGRNFFFHQVPFTILREHTSNSNTLSFDSASVESDDYVSINPDRILIYDAEEVRYAVFGCKTTSLDGNEGDVLSIRDSEYNDAASAVGDIFSLDGGINYSHSSLGFGQVIAVAANGGTNTVFEDEPSFWFIPLGDWIE